LIEARLFEGASAQHDKVVEALPLDDELLDTLLAGMGL
jgi:hypothetical protein